MNREKWLLLFSILIFITLGAYYFPSWLGLSGQKGRTSIGVGKSAAPAAVRHGRLSSSSEATGPRGETVDERTPWGRNPFLTEEEVKGPGSDGLEVKTIIVGPPRSVAVVDGHTVLLGEKIAEETVVEIRSDAVILEREGRRRTLRLSEPSVSVEVRGGKR